MKPTLEELTREGWLIDTLKLRDIELAEHSDKKRLIAELMDMDIKDFGASALGDRLDKKVGMLNGPLVLQLASWRNISYPKIPEHIENDGVCKLSLTDGFVSVHAVQIDAALAINGKTPYGSKVLLVGQIPYECGHLLVCDQNCRVLGGYVEKLVERWKMSKLCAVTVKRVEKGAGYTKFQSFASAKVKPITQSMNIISITNNGDESSQQLTHQNKRDGASKPTSSAHIDDEAVDGAAAARQSDATRSKRSKNPNSSRQQQPQPDNSQRSQPRRQQQQSTQQSKPQQRQRQRQPRQSSSRANNHFTAHNDNFHVAPLASVQPPGGADYSFPPPGYVAPPPGYNASTLRYTPNDYSTSLNLFSLPPNFASQRGGGARRVFYRRNNNQ